MSITKIITGSIAALALASTIAATPALADVGFSGGSMSGMARLPPMSGYTFGSARSTFGSVQAYTGPQAVPPASYGGVDILTPLLGRLFGSDE